MTPLRALAAMARRGWAIRSPAAEKFLQIDGARSAAAFALYAFFPDTLIRETPPITRPGGGV